MDDSAELSPYAIVGSRFDLLIGREAAVVHVGSETGVDDVADNLRSRGLSATLGVGLALQEVVARQMRIEGRFSLATTNQLRQRRDGIAQPQGFDVSVIVAF